MSVVLPRGFYTRPAPEVAPDIIGCRLVRVLDGARMAGIILEAEAYQGMEDLACHAHSGKTRRNEVMFGEPGRAYVYFTYGMHWMLNLVADLPGQPAAVLIRAIAPEEGLEKMTGLRPNLARTRNWLNGPAKLTQALGITREQNGADLCDPAGGLFIEEGIAVNRADLLVSPRIGINYTPEPWLSKPWRWQAATDQIVL